MRDTTWLSFSVILANVTLKHPSTDGSYEQHNFVPNDLYYRLFIRNKARNKLLQGTSTAPKPSLAFFAQNMPIGSQRKMLYSMLIQGSLTNGTLEWINSYKYWNPTITSITVLFQPNQVMFDNVDSTTNIVTNTDDEKRMIPPNYYTIGVIIVLLNTITDTPISISTKASNYGCIWIQAPYNRFHQCSRYSRNPRFGRVYGHSTCFVLWIKRDRDHSQSPSNPSVFIVGAILQSEDCQPEQQSVHYDNH